MIKGKMKDKVKKKKIKKEDFSDLLKHSEKVTEKLWDNKEDEIWEKI